MKDFEIPSEYADTPQNYQRGEGYSSHRKVPTIGRLLKRQFFLKKKDEEARENAVNRAREAYIKEYGPDEGVRRFEEAFHDKSGGAETEKDRLMRLAKEGAQRNTAGNYQAEGERKVTDPVTDEDVIIKDATFDDYRNMKLWQTHPDEEGGEEDASSSDSSSSKAGQPEGQTAQAPSQGASAQDENKVKEKKSNKKAEAILKAIRPKSVMLHAFPPPVNPSHLTQLKLALSGYATCIGLGFFLVFIVAEIFCRSWLAKVSIGITCLLAGFASVTAVHLVQQKIERELYAIRWDMSRERGRIYSPPIPESTEWLNNIMKTLWPIINPEIFQSVINTVEDVMQASLPTFIDGVKVNDFGIGVNSLQIISMRALSVRKGDEGYPKSDWIDQNIADPNLVPEPPLDEISSGKANLDDSSGDYVNLELSFAYAPRPGFSDKKSDRISMQVLFYLGVYDLLHIPIPIWVSVLSLAGTVRLRCQIVSEAPFIRNVTFSLMGVPHVDVGAIPMLSFLPNILDLPFISGFVKSSIAAATVDYVAPRSMTMNMMDMLGGQGVKTSTNALGVIAVSIHYAVNLSAQDNNGFSDPYVVLAYRKYGKPLYSSRIVLKDLNPVFEETAFLLVSGVEVGAREDLSIQLWDSDKMSADDLVGQLSIPVVRLIQRPNQLFRLCSKLQGFNEGSQMIGDLYWSVGFFTKIVPGSSEVPKKPVPSLPLSQDAPHVEPAKPAVERSQLQSALARRRSLRLQRFLNNDSGHVADSNDLDSIDERQSFSGSSMHRIHSPAFQPQLPAPPEEEEHPEHNEHHAQNQVPAHDQVSTKDQVDNQVPPESKPPTENNVPAEGQGSAQDTTPNDHQQATTPANGSTGLRLTEAQASEHFHKKELEALEREQKRDEDAAKGDSWLGFLTSGSADDKSSKSGRTAHEDNIVIESQGRDHTSSSLAKGSSPQSLTDAQPSSLAQAGNTADESRVTSYETGPWLTPEHAKDAERRAKESSSSVTSKRSSFRKRFRSLTLQSDSGSTENGAFESGGQLFQSPSDRKNSIDHQLLWSSDPVELFRRPGDVKHVPPVLKALGIDPRSDLPAQEILNLPQSKSFAEAPSGNTDMDPESLEAARKEMQSPEGKAFHTDEHARLWNRDHPDKMPPPDERFPSGILSVVIHYITGLERQELEGATGQRSGKQGQSTSAASEDSPTVTSPYCELFINDNMVYKTRTKLYTTMPFFEAGTEEFIRDWRTTNVRIAVRDARLREHDAILGIVDLPLLEMFSSTSQLTRMFPIEHGVGFGRINVSVLFQPVVLTLPRALRGWETGTVYVSSDVKIIPVHDQNQDADFSFHWRSLNLSTNTASQLLPPALSASKNHGQYFSWNVSSDIRLPIYNRYSSALFFDIKPSRLSPSRFASGQHAFAALWLRKISDDTSTEITIPVFTSPNLEGLRENYISPQTRNSHTFTVVGWLSCTVTLLAGLDEDHEKYLHNQKERHEYETFDYVEGQALASEANSHVMDDGILSKEEEKAIKRSHKRDLSKRHRGPLQYSAVRSAKWGKDNLYYRYQDFRDRVTGNLPREKMVDSEM